MSGFVFAATIVAAQSDHSISNMVGVDHVRLCNRKQGNIHFRILIFISCYHRVTECSKTNPDIS